MSTNQTQHYALSQWEPSDKVERTDFNSDNAKIDAALRGLSQSLNAKANSSTLSNLSNTVAAKADKSALAALERTVAQKSDQTALTALERKVDQKGDLTALNALDGRVAALDETLSQAMCWEPLAHRTLSASAAAVELDLSNRSMGDYVRLELTFSVSGSTTDTLRLQVNGLTGDIYCGQGGFGRREVSLSSSLELSSAFKEGGGGTVSLFPAGGAGTGMVVDGPSRNGNSYWYYTYNGLVTGVAFDQLATLRLFTAQAMAKGSSFHLMGLKKG